MSDKPQIWIFAGPNGAGKSTLANQYLKGRLPLINPDIIAHELNPDAGHDLSSVALQAGRIALKSQQDFLKRKVSFALETTLTGQRELRLMQNAKEQGYKVNLVYVGIKSEKLSAFRVSTRVKRGGHSIPMSDIERRYPRSIGNLESALSIADRAYILDNSGSRRRLLLSIMGGTIKFQSIQKVPQWLVDAFSPSQKEGIFCEKSKLIQDEANFLQKVLSVDAIRNRITQARNEAGWSMSETSTREEAQSVIKVPEDEQYTLDMAQKFADENLSTVEDKARFVSKVQERILKAKTHDDELEP